MDDARIGAAIRVVRKRHGWSQAAVERRARVTREMVGHMERGAAGRYPLDRLRAVTIALDMRLDVLLRWRAASSIASSTPASPRCTSRSGGCWPGSKAGHPCRRCPIRSSASAA